MQNTSQPQGADIRKLIDDTERFMHMFCRSPAEEAQVSFALSIQNDVCVKFNLERNSRLVSKSPIQDNAWVNAIVLSKLIC